MKGRQYNSTGYCEQRFCALWDSQEDQCCIKTMALKKPVDPIQNIINQSYKHPSDASQKGDW
jgi:hypothetical protein